jgi:hypothetical protein
LPFLVMVLPQQSFERPGAGKRENPRLTTD